MDVGNSALPGETNRNRLWVWRNIWKPKTKTKLRLNIPDTIILEKGEIKRWLFTSKDQTVLKRGSGKATFTNLLSRFQTLYGQQQMNIRGGLG